MCGTHLGVIRSVIFYRKCGSSVKVCVTHLRMRRIEFVFFLAWLICEIECTVSARRIVKIAKYAQAVSRAWSFPAGASSSQSKA